MQFAFAHHIRYVMLCGLFCFVFSHLNRLQRQLQLNITIHE